MPLNSIGIEPDALTNDTDTKVRIKNAMFKAKKIKQKILIRGQKPTFREQLLLSRPKIGMVEDKHIIFKDNF